MKLKWQMLWIGLTIGLFTALYGHADQSAQEPIPCPQCGVWRITSEDSDALVGGWSALTGEVLVADDSIVSIPGCGTFTYIAQKKVKRERGDAHYTYELSMSLKQQGESFLCKRMNGDEWRLDANISGWFAEGGMGHFVLLRSKTAGPVLSLNAWNTDREDPCGNGSTSATVDCLLLNKATLSRMLSEEAQHISEKAMAKGTTKKPPSFSFTRFVSSARAFCYKKEKGYPLPTVGCEFGILKAKFDEFTAWKSCIGAGKKAAKCKIPTEDFDRNSKQSED